MFSAFHKRRKKTFLSLLPRNQTVPAQLPLNGSSSSPHSTSSFTERSGTAQPEHRWQNLAPRRKIQSLQRQKHARSSVAGYSSERHQPNLRTASSEVPSFCSSPREACARLPADCAELEGRSAGGSLLERSTTAS